LRQLFDFFAQGLCARPLDLEPRERGDAQTDRAPVQNRMVSQDEAGFFHPAHAA
jgi:hypothetical protein